MQCNFDFYVFASASLAIPKVVMKNLLHYFWNPISPCSKFCVNCLLRFYFVYCDIFVFNDVNGVCWCTCSLVALIVPDICLRTAKFRENLKFLRCIYVFELVLKNCSDIIEGNWLQVLFHFFVLMGKVSWDIGMSFYLLCSRFLIEVFSFCTFTEKFAIGFQNWFWSQMDWFWSLSMEYGFFRWLLICMDWYLQQLLKLVSFNEIKFSL